MTISKYISASEILAGNVSGVTPAERPEVRRRLAEATLKLAGDPEPATAAPKRVESASPTGLLKAKQAADRLGVDESWIMREKDAGRLPFVRVGRWVRFRPADIDFIVANGTEPR